MPADQDRSAITHTEPDTEVGSRLVSAVADAIAELDAVHHATDHDGLRWCLTCGTADGSWPCVSKQVADDLRAALANGSSTDA